MRCVSVCLPCPPVQQSPDNTATAANVMEARNGFSGDLFFFSLSSSSSSTGKRWPRPFYIWRVSIHLYGCPTTWHVKLTGGTRVMPRGGPGSGWAIERIQIVGLCEYDTVFRGGRAGGTRGWADALNPRNCVITHIIFAIRRCVCTYIKVRVRGYYDLIPSRGLGSKTGLTCKTALSA